MCGCKNTENKSIGKTWNPKKAVCLATFFFIGSFVFLVSY